MKQNHLVQAKAEYEMTRDLVFPRSGCMVSERGMEVERLPARRSAGSSQELGARESLQSLGRKLPVRLRNYDEADRAKSP